MMKSLNQLKKDIKKGVKIKCIAHNVKPELIGTIREVNKTQTNAFTMLTQTADGIKDFWLWYPKASELEYNDNIFTIYEDPKYTNGARVALFSYEIMEN